MNVDWVNYHHLMYFWAVAKEGSITAACHKLKLAQPTISGQLRKLENAVGGKLYQMNGRRLVLTELGEMVLRYAEQIFATGLELGDAVKGNNLARPSRLRVGVTESFPPSIVRRLLEPAFVMPTDIKITCRRGAAETLLASLMVQEMDVVLSDTATSAFSRQSTCCARLGGCGLGVFGSHDLFDHYGPGFPSTLKDAPLLLEAERTTQRQQADQWLSSLEIRPRVIGEFDDNTLLQELAESGLGLIFAPEIVEAELSTKSGLRMLGIVTGAQVEYFAVTADTKIQNPVVELVCQNAREKVFAETESSCWAL